MRQLLFASLGIVAIAVAAPELVTRYLAGPEAAQHAAAGGARAPDARTEASGARQLEVAAAADGHFYVDADINFRPVRLMVDTGASAVALRRSDAEAAGIRVRPGDFDKPVATANGTAHAAEVELDTVTLAEIEVEGVRALILPDEQLAISLLGGSFLNRLARFQVAGGTLLLEN